MSVRLTWQFSGLMAEQGHVGIVPSGDHLSFFNKGNIVIGLRPIARIAGLFIVGLVLLFAIGEGFNLTKLNGIELAMSAAFIVAMIGMIVIWKRERVGGALVVVGMLADGFPFGLEIRRMLKEEFFLERTHPCVSRRFASC